MKNLCIASTLIAGAGGFALVAAPCSADGLRANSGNSAPLRTVNQVPQNEGGVSGATCEYDNYAPVTGFPSSQKDQVYPFLSEAATDFILPFDGENTCTLDEVTFGFTMSAGGDPTQITGINITVYEDAADFCGPGFVKGPAGEPTFPYDPAGPDHEEYCPGSIVCEIKTADFSLVPSPFIAGDWEVTVSGLRDAFQCTVEKEHKYWMSIAPELSFAAGGQTFLHVSATQLGHPDQQIFEFLNLYPWADSIVQGWPGPDLAVRAIFNKDGGGGLCEWDLDMDGDVDAADLATLLGNWGNPYGPVELANLLGQWSTPCVP